MRLLPLSRFLILPTKEGVVIEALVQNIGQLTDGRCLLSLNLLQVEEREREREKGLCTKRGDRKLELDSGWFTN